MFEALQKKKSFIPHSQTLKILHPLNGWQPESKELIEEVPKLVEHLAVKLNIPLAELDKTLPSLNRVEKSVRQKGRRKCLSLEIFPSLVIYVGEVIRQATNGSWELRLNNDCDVAIWEPWIIVNNGNAVPPHAKVYEQLSEGKTCYIRNVAESGIRSLSSSFKPSDPQIFALDIICRDPQREVLDNSNFPPTKEDDDLAFLEAESKFIAWLIDGIKYYRTLGLFNKYIHLSDGELTEQIKIIRADFRSQFLTERDFNSVYLEFADPMFDSTMGHLDPYLLRWDTSRTWSETEVDSVGRNNQEYVRVFERWSEISRGSFLPQELKETWETDSESVLIEFTVNGIRHRIEPEYYEEHIDLEILIEINRLIAETSYRFEVCQVLTDNTLVILLTLAEKQRIERERCLKFERW